MRLSLAALLLIAGTTPAWASELALKRVMLSSAGVGYFEYEAQVAGEAALGLDVPLDQVDDVLTSLVVFDSAGGVGTLELPGRDDTRTAFGNVPFGPAALNSPVEYLNSLQGVEISVQGPRPMTGRIMHADSVAEVVPGPAGQPPATVLRTRVTLLSADGLRQFVLEEADGVQVTDPGLRERIGHALEAARRQTSQTMRHVTLRSTGTASRTVRVAYVAAAPLWKATYRLVLPAGDAETARLQGWAVLENQSGEDWSGVALTLQYGNPVTFRQAIYRSYFVERPEVPVEVLGRILPNVDTRARPSVSEPLAGAFRPMLKAAPPGAAATVAPASPTGAAQAPAPAPEMAPPSETTEATESPEETIFQVPSPVTLAAGHSASVPIVDRNVPAERLDLVPAGSTKPLSSLRVKNNADTSLPAGVLTLYDASGAAIFAGDARLGGLPAGETRLLSFAQDLRTTVERDESGKRTLAALTAADGVLHMTFRDREVFHATINAPSGEGRHVVVEFPKEPDTTFSVEGPPIPGIEETAAAWRVPVSIQPGEVRKLTAYRDHVVLNDLALISPDSNEDDTKAVVNILNEQALDSRARAALEHIVALRQDEARRRIELDRLKEQLVAVAADEERIRKNLDAVSANDALHTRLTRALDADETRIAQIAQSIEQAEGAVQRAHQALADAVRSLRI